MKTKGKKLGEKCCKLIKLIPTKILIVKNGPKNN